MQQMRRGARGYGMWRSGWKLKVAGVRCWKRVALFAAVSLLLSFLLAFNARGVVSALSFPRTEVPHVLILNSYHPGYIWTERLEDAIMAGLEEAFPGVDISSEYLDWKRHPEPEMLEQLLPVLAGRYLQSPPDLIVTTDDAALDFVLDNRKTLFAEIPVVFSGISLEKGNAVLAEHTLLTGVAERLDVAGTLRLALRLKPDAVRAVLVFENSESGFPVGHEAEMLLREMAPELEIQVWNDKPAEEIARMASILPSESFVFFASYIRDARGRVLPMQQYADLLFSQSGAPVFCVNDFVVGHHTLGGSVIDATLHGAKAAEYAVRVLQGEPVENLAFWTEWTVSTQVDYRELSRHDVSVSLLPEDAVILYRPPSVFRDNQSLFMAIITTFILLLGLAVWLLLAIRSRRATNRELQASHMELLAANNQMAAVNAQLIETDGMLRRQNEELEERTRQLSVSEERYRLVGEAARDAIWDWDIPNDCMTISGRASEWIGEILPEATNLESWLAVVHHEDVDSLRQEIMEAFHNHGTTTNSSFRIVDKTGTIHWIQSKTTILYASDGTPIRMAGTHADITNQRRQQEIIAHMAYYDTLTDLPNRFRLREQVETLVRETNPDNGFVFCFTDMDNFKFINDTFGHSTGDAVLKAISARLKTAVPEEALVSRMGGDEFTVIIPGVRDRQQAQEIGEQLIEAFEKPLAVQEMHFHMGMSVGMAIFPSDGEDFDALLRSADTAMYAAKNDGKNRCRLFSQEMDQAAQERYQLEDGLRHALVGNELSLNYQPIHEIADNRLIGFEVLLRWQSAVHGTVSPLRFIPVAEESGLILPIGEWVLAEAARFHKRMCEVAGDEVAKTLRVGVNVSVSQLLQPGFPDMVSQVVTANGLPMPNLTIEVTESLFMESVSLGAEILKALSEKGAHIALDDFGTGYSSLTYLEQLPVDVLKIDKSFIDAILREPGQPSKVGAIIRLAQDWGFKVVAEGVETQAQWQYLAAHGCEYAQGYLVSPPVPEDAALAYLREHTRAGRSPWSESELNHEKTRE